MRWVATPRLLITMALTAAAAGCHAAPVASDATPIREAAAVPAPAGGERGPCADVGAVRVCWDGGSDGGARAPAARLVARPLPSGPAVSPMGWRCAGQGAARTCVDRRAAAAAFLCVGPRCTQPQARLPDDGEWSCADAGGAALCAGGEAPAGVTPSAGDPAWICGLRAPIARDGAGPRVCVDLAPDFPDGTPAGWRCHYDGAPAARRICERDPAARLLADPCTPAHPCVDGSRCLQGRCLPDRPQPSCWLDGDCAGGACRFGSCRPVGG